MDTIENAGTPRANVTNREKIQDIINQQIDKFHQFSKGQMPLQDKEIKSLTELAKLIDESEKLEKDSVNKIDDLSSEELMLIYEFRKSKKK